MLIIAEGFFSRSIIDSPSAPMNVFCLEEEPRDVEGVEADDRKRPSVPLKNGARGTDVLAQTNVMFQRVE